MKSIRIIFISVIVLALLSPPALTVFADETDAVNPDVTVTQGYRSIDGASAYLGTSKITDNIEAAILYEMNSDSLMYAWNADNKMYPSSLVKILTALLAVERGDPNAIVTVSQEALDSVPYYAASADLLAGEQITLSDLLYALLVGSANDAAAVIATHISGSTNAFVNEMNTYAQQIGCTATQFTNVHGLHDENQYTTARDMARILAAAANNDAFLTYFSTIKHVIPATNMSEERELSSGNFLMNTEKLQLYFDQRVTGGRTGTTEDGARCLATLAEQNGMRVVCIVMGSESTYADDGNTLTYGSFKETTVLLDACFTGYQVAQILYEGQVLRQWPVVNGENDVVLCSYQSVYSVLPEGVSLADLSFRYNDMLGQITAPVEAGQVLSDVQVWHNGFCIAQTGLSAMNSVRYIAATTDEPDADQRGIPIFVIVILVLIGSVFGCIILLRGVRLLRIYIRNRRGKRYMRGRRRSR